jgi:hypothetical protein
MTIGQSNPLRYSGKAQRSIQYMQRNAEESTERSGYKSKSPPTADKVPYIER